MKADSPSEVKKIKREARGFEGMTPEERIQIFIRRCEAEEARQAHLTPEERTKRRQLEDERDALPKPWWRNIRKEALEEYRQCQEGSSDGLLSSDSGA